MLLLKDRVMHIHRRNINDSFTTMVTNFTGPDCIQEKTRNGNVIRIDEPVTVTYCQPRERVLFNRARNTNPFFHLYESLWMLAGRNDLAPLTYYNSRMNEFSDDQKTLNGAYGYRWRHAWCEAPIGDGCS